MPQTDRKLPSPRPPAALPQTLDERIDFLEQLLHPAVRARCSPEPGPERLETFLEVQNLALPETVRPGLEGDGDAFAGLLRFIISTNVWLAVEHPGAFSGVIAEQGLKDAVFSMAWTWPELVIPHLENVGEWLGPDVVRLMIEDRKADHLAGNTSLEEIYALFKFGNLPAAKVSGVARRALLQPQFWTGFVGQRVWRDLHLDHVRDHLQAETQRKIALIDELVSAGVIPRHALMHSLSRVVALEYSGLEAGTVESAITASFLLRKYSRATFPTDDSRSYLWQLLSSGGRMTDIASGAIGDLLCARAIDAADRNWYLDHIRADDVVEQQSINVAKALDSSRELGWRDVYKAWLKEVDETSTHAERKQTAQTLLKGETVESPPGGGVLPIGLVALLKADRRLNRAERGILAARWMEDWTGPALVDELVSIDQMLDGWHGGREAAARTVASKLTPSDLVETWPGWSRLLGLDREQARATVIRALVVNSHAAGEAQKILMWQRKRGNRALLTEYQIAQSLVASLIEYGPTFGPGELFEVLTLLDGTLTARVLATLEQHSPSLLLEVMDSKLGALVDINSVVLKSFREGDRREKLSVILHLPRLIGRVRAGTSGEISRWAAANLTAEEARQEYGKVVFFYLDSEGRRQLVDRVFSNPAEAEVLLSGGGWWAQTCRHQIGAGIAASSASLQRLGASQTYRSQHYLQRRLANPKAHMHAVIGQALPVEQLVAELRGEHTPLMKRMAELDTRKSRSSEIRRLQIAALISLQPYSPPQTMEQAEQQAWESAAGLLGLTEPQSERLLERFTREGIDPVKIGMWARQARSHRVGDYLAGFMRDYANGGSVKTWKFRDAGDLDALPAELVSRWKSNQTRSFRVAGKQYKLKFTHELASIYDIGEKPSVNCLHYCSGTRRDGLAGLLSPEVKLIDVRDGNGTRVANAIVRLGMGSRNVVLLEPVYMTTNDAKLRRGVHLQVVKTLEKLVADQSGVDLGLLSEAFHTDLKTDTAATHELSPATRRYEIPAGRAPYTYDDHFGITRHSRFVAPLMVSRRPQPVRAGVST
jgi:hypothetical protein